jgi:sensor histidine kinase regulating citrate/malate metabolism
LQEVIVNLVRNAIEAMSATTDRRRMLRIRTQLNHNDTIIVAVEDTGPGIDPKRLGEIFDAFVTTKAEGSDAANDGAQPRMQCRLVTQSCRSAVSVGRVALASTAELLMD